MQEGKLVYDGFVKVVVIETELNGQMVEREKLIVHPAVGALVVDANKRVGLVRQYRPTIGEYLWEIPAGLVDANALTPLTALLEELHEECEIKPEEILVIEREPIEEFYLMDGRSDEVTLIYYIEVTAQTNKVVADADVEEVAWFNRKEIEAMMAKKVIKDSKTRLALHHFLRAF